MGLPCFFFYLFKRLTSFLLMFMSVSLCGCVIVTAGACITGHQFLAAGIVDSREPPRRCALS